MKLLVDNKCNCYNDSPAAAVATQDIANFE